MRTTVPIYLSRELVALFCVLLATTPNISAAATEGFNSQGEADCAKMLGFTGSAINDATRKVAVNSETCAAYRFLLERNGTGTRGTQCYRSQTDRILKLNPNFAVGLYKSLSEIEKLYGGKNIIQSGFRCDGSNGNHPRGCAADIIWASCKAKGGVGWRCSSDRFDAPEQKWIDANGRKEPYKIHLRLRYAPEGHHVEPVNIQGCSTGRVVGSGNGPPSNSSPMGLGDAFRQSTGIGQQPALPAQPAIPPQLAQAVQQPTQYFQPTQAQPSVAPSGTVGTPTSVGSPANTVAPIGSTAPQTVGTENQFEEFVDNKPSIGDQLMMLAYGTSSIVTSTDIATSVPIIVSEKDATVLKGSTRKSATSTLSATSSESTKNAPHQTQTFVSGDLTYPRPSSNMSRNYILAFLADMKARLLRALEILRPFGLRATPIESDEFSD